MPHLCFLNKGIRLKSSFLCVSWLSMCIFDSPIGKEGCASWDGGKGTWGGQARVFGTVPVCVRVQERAGVLDLEKIKTDQAKEIADLKKRVKKIGKK
nr:hypothetical protein [Tanacetum cinerariifolium]